MSDVFQKILRFFPEHSFWITLVTATSSFSQCLNAIQKHPSRGDLKKKRPENVQQIYRRAPMPKCDFNKVAKQLKQVTISE